MKAANVYCVHETDWPLNRLEKEEEKVRVKNWRASPKPENLQRYYDYACSLKGEVRSFSHKFKNKPGS